MAKTDTDRYDETYQYIRTLSRPLGDKVAHRVAGDRDRYGQLISLGEGNASLVRGIVSNQHHAIRALVLCQNLFLPDGCRNNNATVLHFKGKSESDVKDAILIYTPRVAVSLAEFKNVAERERLSNGIKNHQQLLYLTRKSIVFDGATNCYGAVNIWLVKSGLCSLDWYMNSPCTAYNVNQIVGNGLEWGLDNLAAITPGYIFNIHDANDQNICHWGVVLETDGHRVKWAAASNTEGGFRGPDNVDHMVQFRTRQDNGTYGHFALASSVEVCKAKYSSHQVKVRVLDPTTHRGNYY